MFLNCVSNAISGNVFLTIQRKFTESWRTHKRGTWRAWWGTRVTEAQGSEEINFFKMNVKDYKNLHAGVNV